MPLNNPEATSQALSILRSPANFQWYVIPLLIGVIYVYASEYERGNLKAIASGLALYMIHWFYEILNALIQHFSGHALWTVPTGTAYLLLVGVSIELSLMFAIAGIANAKMLSADPKAKMLGLPNRLVVGLMNAALASIIEIFLVRTPAFVWVYPWWGALPVFVTTYIPFFVISAYAYDWKPRTQVAFIGSLFAVNASMLVVFAGVLGWI